MPRGTGKPALSNVPSVAAFLPTRLTSTWLTSSSAATNRYFVLILSTFLWLTLNYNRATRSKGHSTDYRFITSPDPGLTRKVCEFNAPGRDAQQSEVRVIDGAIPGAKNNPSRLAKRQRNG